MKKAFTILVGFLHDFAAGGWAATLLAVYWLERQDVATGMVDLVIGLQKQFFYAGLFCIAVVMATGAGRTFTYTSGIYGPEAEKTRKAMLLVKHIILFLIFGAGVFWQYAMIFR